MSLKRRLFVGVNRGLSLLPRPAQKLVLSATWAVPMAHRLPRFMAIEPTNTCNLACPLCPVGARTMDRGRGFMDRDLYRDLIAEVRNHVSRILMNFAGEPLMHPHIGELVGLAEDAGIRVTLGTHGNIDKMEELIDAGTSEILFSLDGTTDEVYEKYRVRGHRGMAVENLRRLVAARDARGNGRTRIILQFVVMKHNQHQIGDLITLAGDLGVDEVSLQPVCVNDFFEEPREILAERWTPGDSPYVMHPDTKPADTVRRPPLCVWAIQSVVLFNGDVTVCCFDASGRIVVGNAFEPGGFAAVWHSDAYRSARRKVLLQEYDICARCDVGLAKATRFPPDDPPGRPLFPDLES